MGRMEQHSGHSQEKRKIPDRMPRKESLSAGYALPAFAHNLQGLSLQLHESYPAPAHLSPRQQRKVDRSTAHPSNVVRIEHLQVTGDTVSYDAFPNEWKNWHTLSQKRFPNAARERLAFLTGVSVAWITTEPDGSHKLAVQKRDDRNRTNPATYGPSASGAWDAELTTEHGRTVLKDASPFNAMRNVYRESTEELGLPEALLQDPRVKLVVSGIVEDKRKPHYDITYFGVLPLSAAEVQHIHKAARSNDKGQTYDHTDGLTFVDAKPESIRTMLTEVNSPLPPVSVATFLLAGYMLTMQEALDKTGNEEEALRTALDWKKTTEQGIQKNYRRMRRRSFANNALTAGEEIISAAKKGVARKGLTADIEEAIGHVRVSRTDLPPHKQGLEDIDFALKEAGIERTTSSEYLLDDLLRTGTGVNLYDPDGAKKHAEIMAFIDPTVAHLHKLANVTEVPWFSFLRKLEVSDDPTTNLFYGVKENRLARLQYNIGNGFDFLRIPGSEKIIPIQAETWSSDIKFEGRRDRKLNEDALLTIPFGNGRVLSAVFDGASSQKPIEGLQQYGVTGAWYVSHLASLEFPQSEEFRTLAANPDATAKDVMTTLNGWLKGKLQEVDGVSYDDVLRLPGMAATLAVVDYNKKVVEIAHVADTIAIAEYDDGYEILTDNKNAAWDRETERLVDSIVAESLEKGVKISPLEASRDQRVRDHLKRSFTQKINTPGGTGILNGQDELITNNLIYTRTIPIPATGGMRLHLVSDGIYSVWTNRKGAQEQEEGVRKLLGALHTPQYYPGNPIYDAVTRLELDPNADIMPRIIKAFDDGTRVSLIVQPGDEYSPFRTGNRRLLWGDFAEILDIEKPTAK